MALEVKNIYKGSEEIDRVNEMYFDSFNKDDRVSMKFLLWKTKKDFVDFLAIYDDEELIGFTYLVTHKDLTLVFYLAIDESFRSKGYGKKAIDAIKNKYPNNTIILDIEAIDEQAENYEQRLRREKFYLKNGFRPSNLKYIEGTRKYDPLINGDDLTLEEFENLIKKYIGNILYLFFKPKVSYR